MLGSLSVVPHAVLSASTVQRKEEGDSDAKGACSDSSSETVTRHCLDMSLAAR